MFMCAAYTGSEAVIVGDGNLLPISSIGSSSIPVSSLSNSSNQSSLLLNNILFVHSIAKNLLSISQYTHDNNVLIEFHHDCCYVKDKHTLKVLLKGLLVNGLYQLDLSKLSLKSATLSSNLSFSSNKLGLCDNSHVLPTSASNSYSDVLASNVTRHVQALSASFCTDINTFHRVLGHPNNVVLSTIGNAIKIPFPIQNRLSVKHVNVGRCIRFLTFLDLIHLSLLI